MKNACQPPILLTNITNLSIKMVSLFAQNCYELLRQIPKGKVTTYKIIAQKLGVKSYRAVGQAIGANPDIPKTPCHRVIKSNGELGGYALGIDKKIEILEAEGLQIANGKVINFEKIIYKF